MKETDPLTSSRIGDMDCELMTVQDRFIIRGRGVVLIPDFPPPNGWKDRSEQITVTKPSGDSFRTSARFSLTHYSFTDPTIPADRRWRVTILVPDRDKEEIPVGSVVYVAKFLRDELMSDSVD